VRRYGRTVAIVVALVTLAGVALGFPTINIGNFERGGDDTPLGLSLGLDLQGGSHLVYEADLRDPATDEPLEVTEDQMESLKRTIERRVNSSGLGEPIIQLLDSDRLLIQLPGVTDPERAKSLIGETALLEFKHRQLAVPNDLEEITQDDILSVTADFLTDPDASSTPTATSTATSTTTPAIADDPDPVVLKVEFSEDGAIEFRMVLDRLMDSFLTATAQSQSGHIPPVPSFLDVTMEGTEQLRFNATALPIGTSTTYAIGFPVDSESGEPPTLDEAKRQVGEDAKIFFTEIQSYVDEDIGLTGEKLTRAFPSQHGGSGAPIVNIEFDDEGTRIFGRLTQDIVLKQETTGQSDQIAIFLDDVELISPVVQTPITAGTAIIQGRDFTLERVRDIALLLESGRLPIPITLIQERDVDAILGEDSLRKSVVAGAVGLGLVLLFMTAYYRLPGLLASIALMMYAAIVLAIFKILPVTLTLSGVAAAILSIGMAVDANILIFERMKDELRAGRTLLSAINIGFDRAWPAIRDGNVSTLITCGILFWFSDQLGATIVQGFAATLAIGVVVSMFSAITISRTLLRFVSSTRLTRKLNWWTPSGKSGLPQQATTGAQRS
jgi:protein-export membrane protein SecD|tara:strand:+ start:4774 stop:6606 length:1833 start_codon:yes stop_codon:yes gene_type:complete